MKSTAIQSHMRFFCTLLVSGALACSPADSGEDGGNATSSSSDAGTDGGETVGAETGETDETAETGGPAGVLSRHRAAC